MEKLIRPTTIYYLGEYYADNGLRELCHRMKSQPEDKESVETAAELLSQLIPNSAVLIPIPSLTSAHATSLAIEIALRKWKTVSQRRKHLCLDCLQTSKTVSLYENKKRGEKVSEKDCQFYLAAPVPQGDIVLVDNVIATGTTVSAAQRTLGRRCAVAVVAVDSKENNK